MIAPRAAKVTTVGAAKVIATGAAKVTAVGAAKVTTAGTMMRLPTQERVMSRKRKDMHQLHELVRLHRLGTGAREVARLLGVSPNTEREYRRAFQTAGLLDGPAEDLPALEALKATLPHTVPPQ